MRQIITFGTDRRTRALFALSFLAAAALGGSAAPRAAATTSAAPAGAHSPTTSERGADITRAEVLERAEDWYDRDIQYDQGAEAADPEGAHEYRTDCSGLVAMAWHLPSTDFNTDSLDRRSLTDRIERDELLPGDALDDTDDGHVVLFTGWIGRSAGTFTYVQLANSRSDMVKGTGSFAAPLLAGHPTANYFALRYHRIVDDETPAVPPPVRNVERYPWPGPRRSAGRVEAPRSARVEAPQPARVGAPAERRAGSAG
ncbi:hypothetical protein [Embleya sp. NPDC005971]|uniref:hypothetical protein n=1 Tax=unclassified Embleya TaxID=2699296 RepID=UPI0033DB251E